LEILHFLCNSKPLHFTSLITFQPLLLEILNFLVPSNSPHFTSLITFLTLFLEVLSVEGKVPKAFMGSLFQSWMVLFTKEIKSLILVHFLVLIV
jgi:hypothetical protein